MHQDQDIGIKFYSDCVVLVQRELAASNSNLVDEVNKGKFREDLFFRLNVLTLKIPPLRNPLMSICMLLNGDSGTIITAGKPHTIPIAIRL